ncbi:hypothetical protein MLD38_003276 [Melastoma candidum]|uniref:Uncharacterized protein n=1 Tax=Melastoma candidum TaxID=119954 RepID=A0ACB9S3L0_9MYRT|nr:hypothetical protein MLD38_003276 [Melastoma candidum]
MVERKRLVGDSGLEEKPIDAEGGCGDDKGDEDDDPEEGEEEEEQAPDGGENDHGNPPPRRMGRRMTTTMKGMPRIRTRTRMMVRKKTEMKSTRIRMRTWWPCSHRRSGRSESCPRLNQRREFHYY